METGVGHPGRLAQSSTTVAKPLKVGDAVAVATIA